MGGGGVSEVGGDGRGWRGEGGGVGCLPVLVGEGEGERHVDGGVELGVVRRGDFGVVDDGIGGIGGGHEGKYTEWKTLSLIG